MNKARILTGDLNKIANELNNESCKKMSMIFGSCTAIFDGRIKSYLPEGDRLLFVKKDETLVMHGPIGLKPLNWQMAGAGKINYLVEDNNLVVRTYRPKTKETLEIFFTEVYQVVILDAIGTVSMNIYGSESDLSNYLYEHPSIIDKDFQPTAREFETPFGFLDLKGVDKQGNIMIIEVKKRSATPADAYQLKRYVEYFAEIEKVPIKGILVAQHISQKVMNILQANNLEAVEVPWQEIFPALSTEKPAITIDDFLPNNNE
ncbi:MAG: DUF91 domain-containing protein [Asgard group archaeon]|nr:DUF91 domain-containing protein [Asgard group archaeon]